MSWLILNCSCSIWSLVSPEAVLCASNSLCLAGSSKSLTEVDWESADPWRISCIACAAAEISPEVRASAKDILCLSCAINSWLILEILSNASICKSYFLLISSAARSSKAKSFDKSEDISCRSAIGISKVSEISSSRSLISSSKTLNFLVTCVSISDCFLSMLDWIPSIVSWMADTFFCAFSTSFCLAWTPLSAASIDWAYLPSTAVCAFEKKLSIWLSTSDNWSWAYFRGFCVCAKSSCAALFSLKAFVSLSTSVADVAELSAMANCASDNISADKFASPVASFRLINADFCATNALVDFLKSLSNIPTASSLNTFSSLSPSSVKSTIPFFSFSVSRYVAKDWNPPFVPFGSRLAIKSINSSGAFKFDSAWSKPSNTSMSPFAFLRTSLIPCRPFVVSMLASLVLLNLSSKLSRLVSLGFVSSSFFLFLFLIFSYICSIPIISFIWSRASSFAFFSPLSVNFPVLTSIIVVRTLVTASSRFCFLKLGVMVSA